MNRGIDQKPTKQILVDREIHKLLKIRACQQGETIKSLVEDALGELLAIDGEGKYAQRKT